MNILEGFGMFVLLIEPNQHAFLLCFQTLRKFVKYT